MAMGINVRGIEQEIASVNAQYGRNRDSIFRTAQKVGVYLQAETRKRAPIETGELVASIAQDVTDKGRGRGFLIEVSAGDVKSKNGYNYAYIMHEGIYRAWDHHHMDTGSMVAVKGIKRNRYQGTIRGVFWYDSQGYKHGRKYLTRAWDENRAKIFAWLESAPNVTATFETSMGGKSSYVLGGKRVKTRTSWADYRARAK